MQELEWVNSDHSKNHQTGVEICLKNANQQHKVHNLGYE